DVPGWLEKTPRQVLLDGNTVGVVSTNPSTKTITLAAGLTSILPDGALLKPILGGLLDGSMLVNDRTNSIGEVNVTFGVAPGSELPDEGSPGADLLENREIFMFRPNWGDKPTRAYNWEPELVDFDIGRVGKYSPLAYGTMIRSATYIADSYDKAQLVIRF